jgi:hypothetical protein
MSLVDRWLSRSPREERVATTATPPDDPRNSADLSVATGLRHDATLPRAPTPSAPRSQSVAGGLRPENPQNSAALTPLSHMSQLSQCPTADVAAIDVSARAHKLRDAEAERTALAEYDAGVQDAACSEPVLLPDGRRLHRFRADSIPASAPDHAGVLRDQARGHGAVLVADGHDLIVVERWQSALPPETLRAFKDTASALIAHLRGDARARLLWPPQ